VRSKTQILKTASNLKDFSSKIKVAMEGETLTPESVQDIAMEIQQVAEVASELATEIAEGVPAESGMNGMEEKQELAPEQISMAMDDNCGDKKKEAMDDMEDDDEKKKLTEQVASMKNELNQIKRAGMLEKLATKYASLFPKNMKEAKMNEILTAKQSMDIIQAKVQEASDIITSKTMIKVASMTDSIYDLENDGGEIDISSKL